MVRVSLMTRQSSISGSQSFLAHGPSFKKVPDGSLCYSDTSWTTRWNLQIGQ